MQQHFNIQLRVVNLPSDQAKPHLNPERGICAASFDPNGHYVDLGPAVDHLPLPDATAFSTFLIDHALHMLQLDNPPHGVLFIQAESHTLLSAFYMPDASVKLIDAPSTTRH